MERKMKVSALAMEPDSNTPIVILKEDGGEATLPILIGLMEATAIATEIENIEFPRPMTHDLLKSIIDHTGGVVNEVEVSDLKEDTFYAIIRISMDERLVELDARPSDAIALALKVDAPIFVKNHVLAKSLDRKDTGGEEPKEEDLLEGMDPSDFSKYKM